MNGFQYLAISEPELHFIKLLNAHAVRYLVIGGVAAVYYGRRRPPDDVDILVDNSIENAKLLCTAVTELIGPQKTVTIENLTKPQQHLCLKKSRYEIDVLTSVEGVDFDDAYRQKVVVKTRDVSVDLASKQYLMKIMRIAGREKDIEGLRELEEIGE